MELSAIPNDNGRWRADLKNWVEASLQSDDEDQDQDEEENEKPSQVSGRCISSRDAIDEDSCSDSSKAADLFLIGCVSLVGIILTINYAFLYKQ